MMMFQQKEGSYESIVDAAPRKGKLYRQEEGLLRAQAPSVDPPLTHYITHLYHLSRHAVELAKV